jgi:hypothetical protein
MSLDTSLRVMCYLIARVLVEWKRVGSHMGSTKYKESIESSTLGSSKRDLMELVH